MDGEGIMGVVTDIVDSTFDVIGDVVDTTVDVVGDVVDTTVNLAGDVIDYAVENPLETAAIIGGAYYLAPELLAGEALAADTGLATLGDSVLSAEAAFGTGGGTIATDAALAAGAGASGTSLATDGLITQIFDDGSTLITDPTTGAVVSGTDATGAGFTATDGVGTYADGSALGGTPETTFGGSLANPTDVQKLLDYNAAYGSTNWTDYSKALGQLLGGTSGSTVGGALYGGNVGIGGTQIPRSGQPGFGFTQQLPIQASSGEKTGLPSLTGQQPQLLANLLKG